jgi:hypothetical protein
MPGCYVELLKRLLRVCFTAGTLRPVAGGLAARPYRRVALAWPTAATRLLADLALASWPEARLLVHWEGTHRQLRSAALLAVGADSPDPAQALRAQGWRAWALPGRLGARLANRSPPSLPFLRAWPHAPALLWPEGQRRTYLEICTQGRRSRPSAHFKKTSATMFYRAQSRCAVHRV